jgi:hypothetical protein
MINSVITQDFTYIVIDGLLKVGPGKTEKILERSWNFLTKKVSEPCGLDCDIPEDIRTILPHWMPKYWAVFNTFYKTI